MGARHRTRPEPLAAAIGRRLRTHRVEVRHSLESLAAATGLGKGYLSELERGLVVPGVVSLARIANALDLTLADLVLGDSERERLFKDCRGVSAATIRRMRQTIRVSSDPTTKQ